MIDTFNTVTSKFTLSEVCTYNDTSYSEPNKSSFIPTTKLALSDINDGCEGLTTTNPEQSVVEAVSVTGPNRTHSHSYSRVDKVVLRASGGMFESKLPEASTHFVSFNPSINRPANDTTAFTGDLTTSTDTVFLKALLMMLPEKVSTPDTFTTSTTS